MKKITIAIPVNKKDALLQFLQEETVMHIDAGEHVAPEQGSFTGETQHLAAQLQFALNFITSIEKELHIVHKKSLRNMLVGKPTGSLQALEYAVTKIEVPLLVVRVEEIHDGITHAAARSTELKNQIEAVLPWTKLAYSEDTSIVAPVIHRLFEVVVSDEQKLHVAIQAIPTAVWQEVYRVPLKNSVKLYGELIAHRQDEEAVQALETLFAAQRVVLALHDASSPQVYAAQLQEQLKEQEIQREALLEQAKKILPMREDIMFAYDGLLHKIERENIDTSIITTPFTSIVTGWVPAIWLSVFIEKLETAFPEAAVEVVSVRREEKAPVMFQNSKLVRPFEVVTDLYGKPAYHEVDPSGPLAMFFLIGFGLALTDAGYGIIMMIGTFAASRFLKLKKDMQKMVRVLFYAGAMTVVLGALTGGWFSINIDMLPQSVIKNFLLGVKVIDPLKQPIVLLGIIFAFGIVQLLYAWIVRGIYHIKQRQLTLAILDDFSWVAMVVSIIMWQVSVNISTLAPLVTSTKYFMYAVGIFMIVTQGRSATNIFIKAGNGILSLYGLVAFVSDMLSYSRLLALGLATGIIGLVVNLIAGMVSDSIPVIGVVLAGVVLIGGHVFNLGINALGAYIHSGRLQFVEFFPKFLEGGGLPFRPFGRVGKYVDNPNDYAKVV